METTIDLENLEIGEDIMSSLNMAEEIQSERIAKFTASSDHRLTAGIDDTPEERIEKIKGGKRKSELISLAESLNIQVGDKMTMRDIAEKIEPLTRSELSKGAITYIEEKIIESLTGKPVSDFENEDMANGKRLEEETVWWFEKNYSPLAVSEWGERQEFHQETSNQKLSGYVGCTPDGYIKNINFGFEGKAPKYKTHYRYIYGKKSEGIPPLRKDTLKQIEPGYYWQIVKGLMITGWKGWVFTSYSPDFVNYQERDITFFIRRCEVEEDIIKLEAISEMAVEEMKRQVKENLTILNQKTHAERAEKNEILKLIQ